MMDPIVLAGLVSLAVIATGAWFHGFVVGREEGAWQERERAVQAMTACGDPSECGGCFVCDHDKAGDAELADRLRGVEGQ